MHGEVLPKSWAVSRGDPIHNMVASEGDLVVTVCMSWVVQSKPVKVEQAKNCNRVAVDQM